MPTNHRRIGVLLDRDLESALATTRDRLSSKSQAAQVRELALLGAATIQASDQHAAALAAVDRFLDGLGATSPQGDLLDVSARVLANNSERPATNEHGETPAGSLAWARGRDREY